ncbi:fimbrial protein [Yersinia aldovae]|uniref:Mannose-resistant/Proteus-like fimbrial protein n=2 Tax=Yersinia aldovae TaxID=29483 RepID=A0ABM9SW71_YERAL|nr:fimbrial protein [Yersinia aldovae]CNL43608.1 putative mannose-resistant/Proteus-like fimbrial protein [Yersinia aldovae]
MKKIQLLVLSASLFTFSTLNSANAAPTGSVEFTGSIVDTLCSIVGGGDTVNVALGMYPLDSLKTTGAQTTPKDVVLNLENCPASTATVTFSGTASTNPNLLAITVDGGDEATNVAVALFEENGTTTVPLNQASLTKTLVDGTNTWTFKAAYQALTAGVTAGSANATATFEIAYN